MRHDEAMPPGPSESCEPVVESELDEDLDPILASKNEEFFKSRPNPEKLEQAIS
jgi:hypothetical protein